MSQESNTPTPSVDPLAGLSPLELFRSAEEPIPPQANAPDVAEVAAAFPNLEILGLLGQGGMGFVYKARQPDLDRVVALKILRPELGGDPAFSERFAREARVLAKLNHPNIVTVFEHGQAGRFFYLLMEHVDGVNLRQAMRAGRFTPEQALAIVPGICDALQAAHAQGIWHRDIKPENILLDPDGRVKIVDFGIARIVGDPARDFTLTLTGAALGSAPYMAPEQHERPHEVDHRADIYSLGVVFYEMLTGELPLGRFPNPSERAAVHARIDAIVLQTLEKERDLRQQTATEVKTDIQRAARDGGNAPAEPAPSPSRAESWFSRLPSLVRRSLVAWFGGLFLLGTGFWLQEERISGAAFPLSLGAVAAALGLLGGLWSLFEMRREWLPATGRGLLTWTMLLPVLLAAAWAGAAVGFVSTTEINVPFLFAVPLACAATWVLAWPLRHFLHTGFRSARGWIIAGGLLVTIALAGGKFFQGQWPFIDARLDEVRFVNRGATDIRDLETIRKAAGELLQFYQIAIPSESDQLMMWGYRPGSVGASDVHAVKSFAARLNQLSDPPAGPWIIRSHTWMPAHRAKEFAMVVLPLAALSALAGLLLAGCSWRPGLSMIALATVGAGLASMSPGWAPGDKVKLIPGDLAPLPLFTPGELPREIDFSTPEDTARTIMLAAHRGQRDILREAVTPELAAKLDEENKWDYFSQPGKAVNPKTVGDRFERELERAFRNRSGIGDAYTMLDGKWKMDTPAYANWRGPATRRPRPREPEKPEVVGPKENPVETVRLLNRLANEQNAEAFLARKWKGGISFGGVTPAQYMEPFYGEILTIHQLPKKEEYHANVVAKLKRADGSEKYIEVLLTIQENEWRLLADQMPKYRAWTWVEFKPPQGNAEAILKNHLGDNPFHLVYGTTDRFIIAGEEFSGHGARMAAERVLEQLQNSLAPAGLAPHLKVIAPPEEPAEPWMGNDPVMPRPSAKDP